MKKNLYWDINTEAKFKKVSKKSKKSASSIIRMWAASPKFDAMVEELNKSLASND